MRKLAEWYLKRCLKKYAPHMETVIRADGTEFRKRNFENEEWKRKALEQFRDGHERREKNRPYLIMGSLLLVMCATWYFQGFLATLVLFNTIILLSVID